MVARRWLLVVSLVIADASGIARPGGAAAAPGPAPAPSVSNHAAPAWLGVLLHKHESGAAVRRVVRGSPAEVAGLLKDDVITRVGATATREPNDVTRIVVGQPAGSTLTVQFLRAGKPMSTRALLGARPSGVEVLRRDHVGFALPAFPNVVPMGNAPASLAALKGKVLLVDFWAMWCGPCRATMPHLGELRRQHAAEGFEILGVTPDEPLKVLPFVQRIKADYPQWHDPDGDAQASLGAFALPTLFLIDRRGIVRDVIVGVPDESALATKIATLLAEPTPATNE